MRGSEYQFLAMRTRGDWGNQESALTASALGLTGEAGEVADHIKKVVFHKHELDRDHLIKELGDVLWYVASTCDALDVTMDEVMERNIAKLKARYPDGFSSERSINREQ